MVTLISFDTVFKDMCWKKGRQLSKYEFPLIHRTAFGESIYESRSNRPRLKIVYKPYLPIISKNVNENI